MAGPFPPAICFLFFFSAIGICFFQCRSLTDKWLHHLQRFLEAYPVPHEGR